MNNHTIGTIRRLEKSDFSRVHEIAVAGWRPIFERYRLLAGDEMWNDVWGGWERDWFAYTPQTWNDRGIVTQLDGRVVGFATWWFHSDVLAGIGGNAVEPELQGRGVGSAQIRWLNEMFRQERFRYVKVSTGMDPAHGPARAIYRKAGLRIGLPHSQYYNYLDEVAHIAAPSDVRFRWAEETDVKTVERVVSSAWDFEFDRERQTLGDELSAVVFGDAVQQKVNEAVEAAKAARTDSDTENRLRLAFERGKAVGYAGLETEREKALGVIETMAVVPEARGRGIGCALCMDAFDIFRKQGLKYARLMTGSGEATERGRQMCWNVGLYREVPSIDYYMQL